VSSLRDTARQVEADIRERLRKDGKTASDREIREAVARVMEMLDEKRRERG
jgi:hypothetical protein